MKPRAAVPVPLTLGLILAASGCAFGNRHPSLHYPPANEPQGPLAVLAFAPDAPAVAVAVTDMRQGSHSVVGEIRNGLGMHTADIEVQEDAVGWVKKALERELTAEGFRVVPAEGAPGLLTTELIAIHCDANLSYAGEVSLRAEFRGGQSVIPAVLHVGRGSAGVNWAATEDSYSESLALALQDAARQIAAQLKWALRPPGQQPPAVPGPSS